MHGIGPPASCIPSFDMSCAPPLCEAVSEVGFAGPAVGGRLKGRPWSVDANARFNARGRSVRCGVPCAWLGSSVLAVVGSIYGYLLNMTMWLSRRHVAILPSMSLSCAGGLAATLADQTEGLTS